MKVAADAILAAQSGHAFMGMTKLGVAAIFETHGNPDCHIILRGGKAPNYSATDVDAACQLLAKTGLREQVMIESHLHEGRQDITPGQPLDYGVSVTDACLSMEQTVPVLEELAQAVRARRGKRG